MKVVLRDRYGHNFLIEKSGGTTETTSNVEDATIFTITLVDGELKTDKPLPKTGEDWLLTPVQIKEMA